MIFEQIGAKHLAEQARAKLAEWESKGVAEAAVATVALSNLLVVASALVSPAVVNARVKRQAPADWLTP